MHCLLLVPKETLDEQLIDYHISTMLGTYRSPCRALLGLTTLMAALDSIPPYILNLGDCLPGIHEEPRCRYVALHERIVHYKCGLIDEAPGLDRILFKLIASLEG